MPAKKPPRLEPRLRFPHGGPSAFGPGKASLLQHIARTGSIRTASSRLVLPGDKRGARWVRMVESITVVDFASP